MKQHRTWLVRALTASAALTMLAMAAGRAKADVDVLFQDVTESPTVKVTGWSNTDVSPPGEVMTVTLHNFLQNAAGADSTSFFYLDEPRWDPDFATEKVSDVAVFTTTAGSQDLLITFDSTGWASLSEVPSAYGPAYGHDLERGENIIPPPTSVGATNGGAFSVRMRSVPEPASLVLLGLGGLGLAARYARRRSKRAEA